MADDPAKPRNPWPGVLPVPSDRGPFVPDWTPERLERKRAMFDTVHPGTVNSDAPASGGADGDPVPER
jgi:hypothetical protein